MSHYFQQLLRSSGLVQPGPALPSLPTNEHPSAADFAEISEETSVTPSESSVVSPREVTSEFKPTTEVRAIHATRDYQPAPTPAHPEPGVMEINAPRIEEHIIRPPVTVFGPVNTPVVAAPVSSTSDSGSNAKISLAPAPVPVSTKPSPEKSPSGAVPLPGKASFPAGAPSQDELIRHVFRWVAQNPTDLTPPALGNDSSATAEPGPSAARKPTIRPTSVTAVHSPDQPSAAPALPPERPSTRTQSPAPAAATESSVEISIGTLQIQVEAPPAPPAKNSRRPTTPRALAGQSPSVMQRPAIDLNRLRRGFYV